MSGPNHRIRRAAGFEGGDSNEAQRDRIAGDRSVATKNSGGAQTIVLAGNFTCHTGGIDGRRIRYSVYGGKHQERAKDPNDGRK